VTKRPMAGDVVGMDLCVDSRDQAQVEFVDQAKVPGR
jgi:hypothetical protein